MAILTKIFSRYDVILVMRNYFRQNGQWNDNDVSLGVHTFTVGIFLFCLQHSIAKNRYCYCHVPKKRFEPPDIILILAAKNCMWINPIKSEHTVLLERTQYTLVTLHECGPQAMIETCRRGTWHKERKHSNIVALNWLSIYLV